MYSANIPIWRWDMVSDCDIIKEDRRTGQLVPQTDSQRPLVRIRHKWWDTLSYGAATSVRLLFAVVVCPSLAICTAPTPHKTITVLYRPAFWVLLMIGDGGLVVPDNPGWERWRLICDQWTLDWWHRSGVLRTDLHGGNSWQRLHLRQAPEEEKKNS